MPGLFKAEQVAHITQIVAIATRQQSQPPPPPREVLEEPRRSIEIAQKLGAKPYDDSGDPKASWLWLDRVNKVYRVMGCTDDQRVLFSNFLMEDRAKDLWGAVDRRYPEGISWNQLQQEFTDRFFPHSHKDSKIEEFFRLEQKNMSVSEYEKKFSVSRPQSRSDPIGESEPFSGCETIYWDSLFLFLFFFKLNFYMWYTNNVCNNQQSFTFTNVLPPEWYPLKFIHIY